MKMRLLIAGILLAAIQACSIGDIITGNLVERNARLFQEYEGRKLEGSELTRLTKRAWTFRWKWYRSLIVDTADGLVLIDPFNPDAARALKKALNKKLPGKKVHMVIYSHYHVDHASGAGVLAPRQVIAHANAPAYWRALYNAQHVLKPTRLIKGDTKFALGGTEFRVIDMGPSHTDTLLALFVPGEKVLFMADIGIIRSLPANLDLFIPGVITSLERVARLDFKIYVPSHYNHGTKADYMEALEYMRFMRRVTREALAKYALGGGVTLPTEPARFREMFEYVYFRAKKKYGHWHGFSELALAAIFRRIVGESLGY